MKNLKQIMLFVGCVFISLSFTHHQTLTPETRAAVETAENSRCNTQITTFKGGEELTYKVYYNLNFIWLSAGEVTMKVVDTGKNYKLITRGKTYRSYEWFWKADDYFETIVDKETFLPKQAVRDLQEGKFIFYDKLMFNQQDKKVTSYRKGLTFSNKQDYDISGCLHDMLSVLYYTRNKDYRKVRKGASFPVSIFFDKQEYDLKVTYQGKEKKKIRRSGWYNTVKVSPELLTGDYTDRNSTMSIWATDDKNKLPLLIESKIRVGSVKAVLTDYKGLKYPVTAKID